MAKSPIEWMPKQIGNWRKLAKKVGITLEAMLVNIQTGLKWCYKCSSWNPAEQFSTDKTRWDGRKAECRECDYLRTAPGPTKRERTQKRGEEDI